MLAHKKYNNSKPKELSTYLEPAEGPKLKLANDEVTDIKGHRSVQFSPNNKSEEHALCAGFKNQSLVGLKICDHGFNIVFKKEKAEIIGATGGEIVLTAPRKLDLYQIEEKHKCSQIAAGKQNSIKE